jgi:hypothetical protein
MAVITVSRQIGSLARNRQESARRLQYDYADKEKIGQL